MMDRWEKLLAQILDRRSDANVAFEDLGNLLLHFGFELRTRGSHHVFRRVAIAKDGSKAKAYQVRQVRHVILKYRVGGEA
jgi:hypothetical protein